MEAIIQRVQEASIAIDDVCVAKINQGILVLLGIEKNDLQQYADKLLYKVVNLRIFEDNAGKMNLSLKAIGGELLVVSQFTLLGDTSKGLRPSFSHAELPERARPLYNYFVEEAREQLPKVEMGIFGADMKISLVNDGPVTLRLSVKN